MPTPVSSATSSMRNSSFFQERYIQAEMPVMSYWLVSQRRRLIMVSPGSAPRGHCSLHSPQ